VHGDGTVHPVAEDDHEYRGPVAHSRLELLFGHEETTVAAAGDDGALRSGQLRRDRGWHPVAHRPVGWGELRMRVVVAPVAVQEGGEVARASTSTATEPAPLVEPTVIRFSP
jgi:hypothetical protein